MRQAAREILTPATELSSRARTVTPAYAKYAICLFALIYMLNQIDRQILSILAEPIKRDLNLADWQIGVMSGFAFAVLYTFVGIPIGRLAEYGDRRLIISASVAIWSGFTVVCGAAQTFAVLLAARVGVGLGEAGCTPPAMSLISDYVSKEKRAFASSIYMAGSSLGALLGMVIGGLIADRWGWRAAFFVVGPPGLVIAALAALTIREPRRMSQAMRDNTPRPSETAFVTIRTLLSKRTYRLIVSAATLNAFVLYGMQAFLASFFLRNHAVELVSLADRFGLKPGGFLGIVLGLVFGGAGIVGTISGGWLADAIGRKRPRARVIIPGIGLALAAPFHVWAMCTPSLELALILLFVPGTLNALSYGVTYGIVQGLAPPHMRATATALLLFIVNLVGLGMGPLAIGLVSDVLAGPMAFGSPEGIRWALATFGILGIPAGLCFLAARKTLQEDTVS